MACYLALPILLAGLGIALPAIAGDVLPDPTRPPPAFIKQHSDSATDEAAADASALQSVILRTGQKPVAIIGGERVELGGEYGGARLIKVSETEVVLSGPAGRETLLLTPAVSKKAVTGAKNRPPSHLPLVR